MGANARCIALLSAIKKLIREYETPANEIFKRDFEKKLDKNLAYLKKCRNFNHGMETAVKHVRHLLGFITPEVPLKNTQDWLISYIDEFTEQKIINANKLIMDFGMKVIKDDDVIMTYGRSYSVENLLIAAHKAGKKFSLIIVDNPPFDEGKDFLGRLSKLGIEATYTLINGVAYFMKDVTKIFVGCSSILTNGNVISRVGTAMVGCIASNYRIPFHVFCETYKFSDKNMLDSFGINEQADPKEILNEDIKNANLKVLNLRYDLTPKELVNMVITEIGPIPPTSVPVIIREFMKDNYVVNIKAPK